MKLQICSTEKRKGAPFVRMMRPVLFLGTRGTVLILPSFSTNGERCNYPFRSLLIGNSPCRPFGTCGLAALVSEHLLDQLPHETFRELHGFLGGNANVLCGVADLSPKIRREADTFLAELVLEVGQSDLSLSDVVHNGPPVNVLLPRNIRSQDSQVHLRNALIIAENTIAVKSNRGNRKSPYFRAFSRFLYLLSCTDLAPPPPYRKNKKERRVFLLDSARLRAGGGIQCCARTARKGESRGEFRAVLALRLGCGRYLNLTSCPSMRSALITEFPDLSMATLISTFLPNCLSISLPFPPAQNNFQYHTQH